LGRKPSWLICRALQAPSSLWICAFDILGKLRWQQTAATGMFLSLEVSDANGLVVFRESQQRSSYRLERNYDIRGLRAQITSGICWMDS
jgi:hypothetical protein